MNKVLKSIVNAVLGDQWRKYAMWILGVAVVVGQTELGLSDHQLALSAWVTMAALLAQGLADFGKGSILAEAKTKLELQPNGDAQQ